MYLDTSPVVSCPGTSFSALSLYKNNLTQELPSLEVSLQKQPDTAIDEAKTACDAQLCALHQRHAAHGTTVTAEEERDIVTRMVLTDGARRRRSFEEACATVAATVTSVSAAALGVGEESEDENEMVPEEQLGAMRSEGATDLGD